MKYTHPLVTVVGAVFLLVGCGGYSLQEQIIRDKIPQDFRNYTSGIVAAPTDADIQAAIALGTGGKDDDDALQYAYVTKVPRGFFDGDDIYVRVATPLYLIASHAREQAQSFRKVDGAFIQYARSLRAVRISIQQQYINTTTWNAVGFQRQVMLLRDGVRVEPLTELQAWAGQNPFADKQSKQMQATIARVNQSAAQLSRGAAANMTRPQKEQLLNSYRAMGLSEDQMITYTGYPRDEIREILNSQGLVIAGKVSLSEFDAVFLIDELLKPGHYEIVFRTPQVRSLYEQGNKEIRFPISFASFR